MADTAEALTSVVSVIGGAPVCKVAELKVGPAESLVNETEVWDLEEMMTAEKVKRTSLRGRI